MLKQYGHTFCRSCVQQYKMTQGQCPLDQIQRSKAIVNYQVLKKVESQQQRHLKNINKEFKPSCEQHMGQELILCQKCLSPSLIEDTLQSLYNNHLISYEQLKPQILYQQVDSITIKWP
ncbi:hypothetical protein FGO68_gene6188 [Halteria grandinella]|uniref:RING-type domain-containing protein n=1 Tax=Halteria grandinella TaxID=5974 RepID=A0A8J8T2K0_HALGN|nr:hypothetical protein FGO68_gene6188 [Halteria grandinella]